MKYTFLFISVFLLSCNDSAVSGEGSDTTLNQPASGINGKEEISVDNASGCFMNVTGRDTLVARLYRDGNKISGKLSFDNYQKDGSSGSVHGFLDGDIMKLSYAFASEGTNSVMDVFFKLEDSSIIRGIGKMDVKGDTAYYVDTSSIQYNGSELFRMDCSNVPSKYQ